LRSWQLLAQLMSSPNCLSLDSRPPSGPAGATPRRFGGGKPGDFGLQVGPLVHPPGYGAGPERIPRPSGGAHDGPEPVEAPLDALFTGRTRLRVQPVVADTVRSRPGRCTAPAGDGARATSACGARVLPFLGIPGRWWKPPWPQQSLVRQTENGGPSLPLVQTARAALLGRRQAATRTARAVQ
jgi:hypothetical protein